MLASLATMPIKAGVRSIPQPISTKTQEGVFGSIGAQRRDIPAPRMSKNFASDGNQIKSRPNNGNTRRVISLSLMAKHRQEKSTRKRFCYNSLGTSPFRLVS